MDIAFVHSNFPGQFRNLATLLAKDKRHRIIFLTERKQKDLERIDGVEIINFSNHRQVNNQTHHYLHACEEAVLKGQAVIRELAALMEKGFNPKVIVSHSGMGLGLFIKDLLPRALHIGYFEWYFRPETTKYLVKIYDFDAQLKTGTRNLPILQELDRCDVGIVPTAWQKKQFPVEYSDKLNIIFDGIDTSFFHLEEQSREVVKDIEIKNRETGEKYILKSDNKIVSYATRGMEPVRGFPEFMRAAKYLLSNNKSLQVVVAGCDRRAYSYDAPDHEGSWKEHLLEELGEFEGRERLIFTGLLNYSDYRSLLWRTDLHCYFTRPYVISWSLFEAASCGTVLAVNKSEATKGITEEKSVCWVDLDDQERLNKALAKELNKRDKERSRIKKGFELDTSMNKWGNLINKYITIVGQ